MTLVVESAVCFAASDLFLNDAQQEISYVMALSGEITCISEKPEEKVRRQDKGQKNVYFGLHGQNEQVVKVEF